MKKIIPLLLGLAMLTLTGCPLDTSKTDPSEKPEIKEPTVPAPDQPNIPDPPAVLDSVPIPDPPAVLDSVPIPDPPVVLDSVPIPDLPAVLDPVAIPDPPTVIDPVTIPDPPATVGKAPEVLERIAAQKAQWGVTPEKNAQYKPKLLVSLPADIHQPDGMTVNPKTKTIFLNCPNFNHEGPEANPGALVRVNLNGDEATVEKLLVYKDKVAHPDTGKVGPMGLFFGPDGHLYVCDNQYFFGEIGPQNKSRMLRVRMDGDNPTGEIEIVIEGTKLSNAALWVGDRLFVTDTFLDLEGEFGAGCVWMFTLEELSKAGTEGNPPIKVNPIQKIGDDPHCVTIQTVKKLPGCGNGGADGMTADKDGVIYFGNFGNGELYRIVFDVDGKATTDTIHEAGAYFSCCDGIFYDADTNKIYVNDSAANAIHAFVPPAAGEKAAIATLWENGDTDGADGSLDQPCEVVIVNGIMVIANFDWPFPELLNTKTDGPNTLSLINLR